ncbi:conserved hypothetical protein [Vibrio jasicida]|uniref:hypothetical protein n=1 Tax=Vibrio jasicida TaxID=766224 RepID=UPI0028958610|nr:conserved hypothetical protein [Vibrio jasicida]
MEIVLVEGGEILTTFAPLFSNNIKDVNEMDNELPILECDIELMRRLNVPSQTTLKQASSEFAAYWQRVRKEADMREKTPVTASLSKRNDTKP